MFAASLILSFVAGFYYYFQVKPEVYVFLSYAVIIPLLLFVPRLVYRMGNVRQPWLKVTDALGLGFVLLNVPGTMWFHSRYADFQYDRFLHFGGAFLTVITLMYFWVACGGHASIRSAVTVFLLVFTGMFVWEFFQWSQDKLFGTHMFYDYAQSISWDFSEDLIYGGLGIIAAIPLTLSLLPSLRALETRHHHPHVSHR